jgi:hypothetical protein
MDRRALLLDGGVPEIVLALREIGWKVILASELLAEKPAEDAHGMIDTNGSKKHRLHMRFCERGGAGWTEKKALSAFLLVENLSTTRNVTFKRDLSEERASKPITKRLVLPSKLAFHLS